MAEGPSISVRLLMLLAGHGHQPARAEWAARFTYLGVRARMTMKDGLPKPPIAQEVAEVTGQAIRVVRRNMDQLELLGMFAPGVLDDPAAARPEPPGMYFTYYDLPVLVDVWRRTQSYQTALLLVHLMTFFRPGVSAVPIGDKFRNILSHQMGVRWVKLRPLITRLRKLKRIREVGSRGWRATSLTLPKSGREDEPVPDEQVKHVEPEQKEPEPETREEAPAPDVQAFDDVPLSEVYDQILEMGRSVDIEVVKAANLLARRYNQRVDGLIKLRDVLSAVAPEKATALRARFAAYTDDEINRLDVFPSSSSLKEAVGRDLTPAEMTFYRLRLLHLAEAKPPHVGEVSVGTYVGRPEPKLVPPDEIFRLTREQERKWDSFIRKAWEETHNRLWPVAKAVYRPTAMRPKVVEFRKALHEQGRLPLHLPEEEEKVRQTILEIVAEAGEDARDNPRARDIGFTPGLILTYYRIQLKKGVVE